MIKKINDYFGKCLSLGKAFTLGQQAFTLALLRYNSICK
jgi:hypothetical protein